MRWIINLNTNYLGSDGDGYTPNQSTWLFVLIHRYRTRGISYADALIAARAMMLGDV